MNVPGTATLTAMLVSLPLWSAPPALPILYPPGGQRGTTVVVETGGADASAAIWIDRPGLAATHGKAGQLKIAIADDAEPGLVWIRLTNADGASLARPFFVSTLPEVLDKEPNDDFKKPQKIEGTRVIVSGKLDKSGDADVFAVTLQKGDTLVASIEAFRTLRSPMDGILQILSADGFVLQQNQDFYDLDPLIAFAAPKSGVYLVRVQAFPSVADSAVKFAGGEKFVYRLTLTNGPFIDYAYPSIVQGPGTVQLVGWNLPEAWKAYAVAPPEGARSLTIHPPDSANGASLVVDAAPVLVGHQGAIPIPSSVVGKFTQPGERHHFTFDAKKAQKIAFKLESQSLGLTLDGLLRLPELGPKGLVFRATKPNEDSAGVAAIAKDGTYALEIADLYDSASPRHVYRLRAGGTPDFDLKVAADRYALAPGTPLDIPVTIDRQHGHVGEIDLKVEGLPADIEATVVKTPKGVTVQLKTASATWSGPIRIVGVAGKLTRVSQAVYAEYATATPHLWLTASAGAQVVTPVPKKKK